MFEHQAFLNYAQGGSCLKLQIDGRVVVVVVVVMVKGKQMNVMLKDGS